MSHAGFDRHSVAILATTLLWGTYWIPLRALDGIGQGNILFTGVALIVPALLMLLVCWQQRSFINRLGPEAWLLGLSFGIAGSFYAEGALRGNVARVILLFYLTPVWSTLFARLFLNEPISGRRAGTLLLGLAGMYVILDVNQGIPLPSDIAEWLGLIAGISWGIAMVYTNRARGESISALGAVIFICFSVVFLSLTLIPGGRHWDFNAARLFEPVSVLWILALAIVWNLPAALLTLFGAQHIEPGKVAILLMMEVVIGVSTAAWLTDEPFGLREIGGALLIIGAGIIEFVPIPRLRPFR